MSLFALVGPGQDVELGEVRGQIIKRSRGNRQKMGLVRTKGPIHRQERSTWRRLLYGGKDGVVFSQEHKGVFLITKQPHLLIRWRPGGDRC